MTDPLLVTIWDHPITIPPRDIVVDWGRMPRGQGKRIGGMIRGAMSSMEYGVKTYSDPFGNLPDIDEIRADLSGLRYREPLVYLKARSYGLDHETAMRAVYEDRGDVPPGFTESYLLSKGA